MLPDCAQGFNQGFLKEQIRDYDLLNVVMLCLGGADGKNYDGVLKLLDVLLSSETGAAEKKRVLQDDFDIPMTQTLESEVRQMCNLSQGVEEKGRIKGRAEGKAEERLSAVRNLMDSMGWSAEQALEALKVPESERQRYADLIQKQ